MKFEKMLMMICVKISHVSHFQYFIFIHLRFGFKIWNCFFSSKSMSILQLHTNNTTNDTWLPLNHQDSANT